MVVCFFFFKQKTAYDMRISDWSSDVCSSDLFGTSMHFFEEAKHIWQTYVPKRGQAGTVQGELLRAVEKLRDEAIRNGNGNLDDGFDLLIGYLERHLTDLAVYSQNTAAQTKPTLDRLRDYDFPYLEDDLRSEEHTSELQSLLRISYAVFCLKKKKTKKNTTD